MPHPEIELARANAQRGAQETAEAIQAHVQRYVEDYEFRGEGADHTPTEDESALIMDAVQGLIADEEFVARLVRYLEQKSLLKSLEV